MKSKDPGKSTPDCRCTKGESRLPHEAYGKVVDKVFSKVLVESGELEEQRISAPVLAEELLAHSSSQRRLLLRNSCRYHAWPLVEELLARCQEGWAEDPLTSEELATLALEICSHLKADGFRSRILNDLRAEAWSYVGNCRRIRSDLRAAQAAFGQAEESLAKGSADPSERARLDDLRSSLLGAQRDFDGAVAVLSKVTAYYRKIGNGHREGRALLKKAKFLSNAGRVEEAIPVLRRAAALLDCLQEPRMSVVVRHNLMATLIDAERLDEAQQLVPEVRELARKYANRHDRLRLLWTDGLLRQKLGQLELAEEALSQVRDGFIAASIGYDVAQASLDLAALYLETGRTAEVRRLAVETMPIFISLNVQRELLMAWQLFQEAAERDAATLRLVNEVAARIRDSLGAIGSDAAP